MRRIGFDARLLGRTGIGTYVAGLLSWLPDVLRDDTLVVFAQPQTRGLAEELIAGRTNVEIRSAPGNIYRVREQLDLPWRFRAARLDLLHSPHYNRPLAYWGPSVVTIHDLIPYVYPEIHSSMLPRAWNRVLIMQAVRAARHLVVPSAHTARDLGTYLRVPDSRITVIPEAAGARWNPSARDQEADLWMRRAGIQPPFLLYTGRWTPYKNVLTLLDAFDLVMRRHETIQLVIAGSRDPRYPRVAERARELGSRVVVTGWVPEEVLPGVMSHAMAFVFPSEYEGFGLPVLEAMAAGTPVACAAATSLLEVAGDAAALWDVRTGPQGLAAVIEQVLVPEEAARLRERGFRQAARFSWAETARRTVAVYLDALQ